MPSSVSDMLSSFHEDRYEKLISYTVCETIRLNNGLGVQSDTVRAQGPPEACLRYFPPLL